MLAFLLRLCYSVLKRHIPSFSCLGIIYSFRVIYRLIHTVFFSILSKYFYFTFAFLPVLQYDMQRFFHSRLFINIYDFHPNLKILDLSCMTLQIAFVCSDPHMDMFVSFICRLHTKISCGDCAVFQAVCPGFFSVWRSLIEVV